MKIIITVVTGVTVRDTRRRVHMRLPPFPKWGKSYALNIIINLSMCVFESDME